MVKVLSTKDIRENGDLIKDYIGKPCYTRGAEAMKKQEYPDSIVVGIDRYGFIETRYIRHINFPTKFSHTYVIFKDLDKE